jgi:hypothetical protein
MRRALFVALLFAVPAGAQTVRIPAVAVGAWEGRSTVPPRDSVIATYTLTVTADASGLRMKLPNRDPQTPRIIAAGGDSVVTETGPYDSVARPGLKVTTRTISHFKGDSLFGSFTASYSDGSVTRGRTSGIRAVR